ncbi:hypothetical protein ACFW6V_28340 [Streptomyces sp. NPDC058734]
MQHYAGNHPTDGPRRDHHLLIEPVGAIGTLFGAEMSLFAVA